jgi:hypothetical protein
MQSNINALNDLKAENMVLEWFSVSVSVLNGFRKYKCNPT